MSSGSARRASGPADKGRKARQDGVETREAILARKVKDAASLVLWCSSVWAQVSVYALADSAWHKAFRPKGAKNRAWARQVSDHICKQLFSTIDSRKEVR